MLDCGTVSQSIAVLPIHLVFSTKGRIPLLSNLGCRARVHAYLAAVMESAGCRCIKVGGVADHVHLLGRLGRECSVAALVRDLKRSSTVMIRREWPALRDFSWQGGYGAFGVSVGAIPAVRMYIENQEQHHARMDFKDEIRNLLKSHGESWDERYLFD